MSKFILSYRSERNYDWFADPEGLVAWGQFLNEVIAPKVIDVGWPAFDETAIVGEAGAKTPSSEPANGREPRRGRGRSTG